MSSLSTPQLLPKVGEIYGGFPLRLITPLRDVTGSSTAKEALGNYCSLFDQLTAHIADLANSVYVAQAPEAIDERLEEQLRKIGGPLSLGHKIAGVRALGRAKVDFSTTIPQLRHIFDERRLPSPCARMARAFELVREACEEFAVRPSHVQRYVERKLPSDGAQSRCSFDDLLDAFVPIRNKGFAHLDETSWFPNDPLVFNLVCSYIAPAVDSLLTWEPMRSLLTDYEVVEVESPPTGAIRTCPINRPNLPDGRAPLGISLLRVDGALKLDKGARVVARRLSDNPRELDAVVRHVQFPRTLHSPELLARRYAEIYLQAYLEHGLITPGHREVKLNGFVIAEPERKRVESEIQLAINNCSEVRDEGLRQLGGLLGDRWAALREKVETSVQDLPERRKNYVFSQIYDNTISSFAQLRAETELNEVDLDSVLSELELDNRVLRAGDLNNRQRSYYKAQEPGNRARLISLLSEVAQARRQRPLPAPLWKIVILCTELLAEDGIPVEADALTPFEPLFDKQDLDSRSDDAMHLRVGPRELIADSVRDLFEQVAALLAELGVDPAPAIPSLMGRTRYLVASSPVHLNGTRFTLPMQFGDIVFEGNLVRVQALAEIIRWLAKLGLEASSPNIEQPQIEDAEASTREVVDTDDERGSDLDGSPLRIDVIPPGHEPILVEGSSVRRFLAALLELLLRLDAPLAEHVPIATGRVRYLLHDEPYHRNGRPFDAAIERGGYFMNTAYTHEQALSVAIGLCKQIGWRTSSDADASSDADGIELAITIGDQLVSGVNVANFFRAALPVMFEQGILTPSDIPYKVGRLRYLISDVAIHGHGREFIRPIEVTLGGKVYQVEANVSRQGALDMLERLLASKQAVSR